MVFWGTSIRRANSPAGTPSGSRATSSRNVSSRVDWASAAKAAMTSISSIYLAYQILGTLQSLGNRPCTMRVTRAPSPASTSRVANRAVDSGRAARKIVPDDCIGKGRYSGRSASCFVLSPGLNGHGATRTGALKQPGRGRDGDCSPPPAQIPACGFPAPGSCRRSDVIASKAFSSARNLDPCATRFGGMSIPVLRPGLAWRSTLPPAAPLPSTPSASAHTLSPRAITALFGCFIGTTSASDSSAVPRQIALLACCRGPGSPQRLRTRRGLPGSDAIPLRVMGSSTTVERQRLA